MAEDVGRIVLNKGTIEYSSKTYGAWRCPVEEVAVIAETTNESGPFTSDFFCVLVRPDGTWYEVPWEARGLKGVISAMEERVDCRLHFSLFLSTDFRSRILWPPSLTARPLFRFKDVVRSGWDKVLRFWEADKVHVELTDEVLAFLAKVQGSSLPLRGRQDPR